MQGKHVYNIAYTPSFLRGASVGHAIVDNWRKGPFYEYENHHVLSVSRTKSHFLPDAF